MTDELNGLDGQMRREELKRFLTTRRERISPREVGLIAAGRRRTRGLTREDVAQLAGVSLKWYALFESGAAAGVSRKFLDNISRVLQLNRVERHHLFSLLGFTDTHEDDNVAPTPEILRRLADELTNVPAVVYSSIFDVLHCNAAYDAIFEQSTRPAGIQSNKLWRLFLQDRYRAMWRDWERVARYATSELRYLNLPHGGSPGFRELLGRLQESPDFTRMWNEGDVDLVSARSPHFELDVPDVGLLAFDVASTISQHEPLVIFAALLPSGDGTRQKIDELLKRRVVIGT